MQLSLVQWVRWYKSIYEMLPNDKPEDDVIEDDVALDRWFQQYLRESARKLGQRGGDSKYDLVGEGRREQPITGDGNPKAAH